MRLTIVRHARAGSKQEWTEPDNLRPLDARGTQQALDLAPLLSSRRITRLISSPTVRCVQTLQPLAASVDLPIEQWSGLARDADVAGLVAHFGHPSFDDAVLCTHGEVMRPLLRILDLERLDHSHRRINRRRLLTKGSAWRLRISDKGRVVDLQHIIPGG